MNGQALYRDLDSSQRPDGAIRDHEFFPDRPPAGGQVIGRGLFRVRTVRSGLQSVECDFSPTIDADATGVYHPYVALSLLLKGAWASRLPGHASAGPTLGVPCLMVAARPVEYTTTLRAGQGVRMTSLCIDRGFFDAGFEQRDAYLESFDTLAAGNVAVEELDDGALKQLLTRLAGHPYRGALAGIYVESLALSAVVHLASRFVATSPDTGCPRIRARAVEARRLIDARLADPPSVRELAVALGIGVTALRSAFKATYGVTLVDYLREQRLELARVLLCEPRLQVSQVAYRVGYSNLANFSNAFRRRFGHAPSHERQRAFRARSQITEAAHKLSR